MNTNKLHKTSLGRILLMSRVLERRYRMTNFWFVITVPICFLLFGRIMHFFNVGEADWHRSVFESSDYMLRWSWILSGSFVYIPMMLNRNIRNGQGISFSLIPARVYEKITAIFLHLFALCIALFSMSYLTNVIDWLINPEYSSLVLSEQTKIVLNDLFIVQNLKDLLLSALLFLSFFMTASFFAIRVKKFWKGYWISTSLWIALLIFSVNMVKNWEWLHQVLEGVNDDTLKTSLTIVLALLNLGLFWASAQQVKKIEN